MPKVDPRVTYLKRLLDRKDALAEIDGQGDHGGYIGKIPDQPEDVETKEIRRFGDEKAGPALTSVRYGPRDRGMMNSDLVSGLGVFDPFRLTLEIVDERGIPVRGAILRTAAGDGREEQRFVS